MATRIVLLEIGVVVGLLAGFSAPAEAQRAKAVPKEFAEVLASSSQMDFVEVPLSDVVAYLKDAHKIEIQLDQRALSEVGLSEKTPLTMQVRGVSLASGLLLSLRQLNLACVAQPGFLLVTTPAGAKRWGGQVPGLTTPKASLSEKSPAAQKIGESLAAPATLEFIETPLTDVLDFLRERHHLAIFLDGMALADAGIKPATPVTLNLQKVPLQGALLLLTSSVGLTCARQEEFLVVTTRREAKFWGGSLKPLGDTGAGNANAAAHDTIRKALASPTRLEFVETPLSDVVDYLKEFHKIPILLDQRALTDQGVRPDSPITQNIKGVPLESALRLLLDKHELTFVVENGVLLITTQKSRAIAQSAEDDQPEGFRTWTDATGQFTLEAEFVRFADGKVTLRKRDGSLVTLLLERLSESDQQRVLAAGK